MSAVILVYHRIAEVDSDPWSLSVSPRRFAEHLEVLRRDWRPISLAALRHALARGSIPERSVVLTFDDGYADNLHLARPLLERFEIPATVFVVAGPAPRDPSFWWDELECLTLGPGPLPPTLSLEIDGQAYSWDISVGDRAGALRLPHWRAGEPPPTSRHAAYYAIWERLRPLEATARNTVIGVLRSQVPMANGRTTPPLMRSEEIVALGRDGLVEIGAHTVTHPSLAALPLAAQKSEIEGSRNTLAALLGRPVVSFAYPFGADTSYSAETVALVRELGFAVACTTSPTTVDLDSDPLRLPRHQAENWDGEDLAHRLRTWFARPSAETTIR
ncbi:MAG: polysaccharide deacetylase family protein [Gemmatimonadales bacterium]